MKPIPDCVPEALSLVLETARMVSDDGFIHRKVLMQAMAGLVEDGDLGFSAPELYLRCLQSAYKSLGVRDPYEKEKARRNKSMLGLEKSFRSYLDVAPDRLGACLNLALAGSLGSGVLGRAEAEREILENLDAPAGRDERESLVNALGRAESVLYVTEGAGEIVLDKLLIEEIARRSRVAAVVFSVPLLDLATVEDAEAVGLGKLPNVKVIDTGGAMLGLMPERSSGGFREALAAADVVIARGEHNFESLQEAERELFFLLRAECASVAARVGVPVGAGALFRQRGRSASGVYAASAARKQDKSINAD